MNGDIAEGEWQTLKQIERQVIENRIEAHSGNKSAAAKSLGISLKTLYNRLNSYKAASKRAAAQ